MKIKTGSLALLSMLLVPSPTQAAFGGFRVGLSAGGGFLQGRHIYSGPNSPTTDMIKRLSKIGFIVGGHAGYLFELGTSKFLIGGEVYYLMPSMKASIDLALQNGVAEGTVSIKHARSIGFAATVGYMLNPMIMVYINLGLDSAKFTLAYKMKSANYGTSPTLNHNFSGFTPGLGGMYRIAPNFLIGAEASAPFYKKFVGSSKGPRNYSYKPVERRVMIKLTYVF